VADHSLIDAYLATLARRLPTETVEELADGLEETYQMHLAQGLASGDAATAAVAEFGCPAQVTAAFARHSSGRRTAVKLLATAPIFAALWGTTLITSRAWTWPIPPVAGVLFGIILLTVACTLLLVATSNNPRRSRLAAPATAVLILLDLGMVFAVLVLAPALTWPVAIAAPASLARVAVTARTLPPTVRPPR
jgi:hypothetical protein